MILLVSCDNFLNGLDAKNQLEDGISYANARSIEVLVNAAEGTGTTVPSGHYTAKSGYPFEVSFTENADYAFAGWKAVFESDGTEASEGIHFDDPSALKTNVIISTEGIKVVPQCIRRIYIDGEPLPKYEATGVSRDRSITVNFSEPPAADSFLFTEDEIPAGALPEADESGIWAYRLNGLTYFKNIEITGADEISLAAHFKKPEVDGNLLTIAVDKSNPIEIDTGANFKIIKVTISDKIKASNGITINSGKTWRYQVTNETDEKATVTLSSEVAEGSVYLAGTRDYSIGQKLTLAFTESADYQFIRWDYDSSVVHVAEPLSASTTALIMEKSTGTQIKAVCAPRLRVLSFTPQNDVLTPTVSKNSSIVITFSQNLPSDERMLNNISIAVGGSPVKNSFSSPRVNGNIITFSADKTNMLDVYAGQTKTVTVTVPADFYYETEEGYKVTYGGNGISFDYKIDNSTIEKAEIIFSSVQGSGTITPESGNVKHYSIGEEVAISFLVSDGWQFNGWKVTGADESVLSKIKIADENLPSTKLTILEAVTGVTVSADVSECLRVISRSPSAESNYKDSDIVLTFNKSLDSECSSMLNKIRISWDGTSLDGCYTDRILSADGKTITVKSTAVLSVPKNSEKTISVFIPSDFFYKNANGLKIYHEEESFSFKVNHTTKEKAKITYSVINGETETPFSPAGAAGTINRNSYEEYNLGEEVDLSFDLNPGYQFYGWKIVDSDDNAVTNDIISFKNSINTDSNSTLAFNKACNGITVYAVCYLRPSVITESLEPYSTNSLSEFPKNSTIIIHFNHKIVNGKDDIVVNYTGPDFTNKSEYFTTVLSSDGQTITLTPKKILKLNNSYETVTVKLPHDALYYLASDNKTKITIGDEDFSWNYRVNNTTVTKTVLRINTADANGNYILVNDAPLSSGSTQNVNVEQTVELEYPMEEGYEFLGWQIESASSGITVSPSGYVKSGSITVGPSSDPSFVLEIDRNNHLKARITSYKSVSVGSNGWGISVSAKDVQLPYVESIKLDNATDIFSVVNTIFDSRVSLNFSKPVNTTTAVFSSTGAVSIVKAGTTVHYESYFTTSWSSDRKQLVLTPKETLKQLVPLADDILSMTIKLNANGKTIKDTDGYALIATKNINNSFDVPYTITGTRETTKPVFNSFTLYKPQYTNGVEVSGSYTSLYASARSYIAPATATNSSYSSYVSTNHVNKKLFFDMSASDSQSGLKSLTIKETFLRYSGEYSDLQTPIISPTETYSIAAATKRAYTLKSEGDGLVQLDFIIEDYAGNSTIKTYFVHKDSTFDPSSIIPGPSFTGQSNYRIPQGTTGPVATYDGESGTTGSSTLYSYYTDTQSQVFNNQVVFDLSNSFIKDIYYSSGSASKLSTIYADVKWGYSENSITETMTYDSTKKWYVLTDAKRSDLTKDVYVQFTVRDEVGNTGSLIRCLPGHAALLNPVIYDATPSGRIYKYWQIKDLIASGYADRNSKISSIGATRVDYMLLYRYKENSSSSWSEYRYNSSRFYTGDWLNQKFAFSDYISTPKFKPLTWRPYGIYEIRLLPYYQYGERVYWGSVSAQTLTVNYTNSTTGPTVVYSGSSSTATVPSSLYVSISEKPKNTGYHKLYAYSSSFTRTSGYTYYIWYKKSDETNYNYTEFTSNSGFDFTVPSGYTYDFGVYAVNTATGQSNITAAKRTLACTYDNVPPAFADSSSSAGATDMFKRIYSSDGFSLKTIKPKDTGVGLYTNAQGEVCLDYYVIKNDAPFNTSGVAPLAITLEDITSENSPYADYKKTLYYKESDTSVFVPYGPLDEGVYTVCFYLKDKNLNDAVYNFTVHNRLYSNYKTPTIEVVTASTSTSLTNPFTALRVSTATQFGFSSLNMTTKKWAGISSVNGNTGNGSSTYETFKHSSSATSCENMNPSTYFYKTDGSGGSYGWGAYMNFETFYKFIGTDNTAHNKYYYPVYIYPDYYGRKGTSTELVCSNKNLLDGAGVYQVFYDNPMFVHTLCYPTNLGKEAGLWEAKGTELSIETRKDVISTNSSNTPKTFTYIPDVSSIPAGWYYVAVAHFADGTTIATTPVMK